MSTARRLLGFSAVVDDFVPDDALALMASYYLEIWRAGYCFVALPLDAIVVETGGAETETRNDFGIDLDDRPFEVKLIAMRSRTSRWAENLRSPFFVERPAALRIVGNCGDDPPLVARFEFLPGPVYRGLEGRLE